MKNIKLLLTTVTAAAIFGCANNDDYNTPDLSGQCVTLTPTKTVTDITSAATGAEQQYTDDDIFEAYVTGSDEGGNIFKTVHLVNTDNTIGFSIPVDAYNTYSKFEPGRKVYINLKNRYFVKEFGSTVLGSLYNNDTPLDPDDDEVGRISLVEYEDVILRSCEQVNENTLVKHLTIAQAKQDQYLNMLIEFDNVQFTDESMGKKYFDPSVNNFGSATNHQIIDENGTKIILRASKYATFAANQIPNGNGKIRGVLTKFNSDYQFMIRTTNDVQLTNTRISPLFEEPFTTNYANWIKYNVTGAQTWTLDNTNGNPGQCAKMSGFANNTNNVNDDWLISPVINLTDVTTATLTYDNTSRFAGNLLQVYISANYVSGAPNTATWTEIGPGTLDTETGTYQWISSGPVNISAFTGNNVRIAFRYTSTASASRTWEVDNVKVVGQ